MDGEKDHSPEKTTFARQVLDVLYIVKEEEGEEEEVEGALL